MIWYWRGDTLSNTGNTSQKGFFSPIFYQGDWKNLTLTFIEQGNDSLVRKTGDRS